MSVRSVSHVVAVFMVNGNQSGQVSFRFHVVWQVLKIWSGFDSEGSLRSTERPHGPSVLQVLRPMCLGDLQLTTFKPVSLSLNG